MVYQLPARVICRGLPSRVIHRVFNTFGRGMFFPFVHIYRSCYSELLLRSDNISNDASYHDWQSRKRSRRV